MNTEPKKTSYGRLIVSFIVMLLLCGLIFGGVFLMKGWSSTELNKMFNQGQPPQTVDVIKVKTREWTRQLTATATLGVSHNVDITTETPGIIQSIEFRNGDVVKQGDILIELDKAIARSNLAAATATAKQTGSDLKRIQSLANRKAVSQADLDAARSRAQQAQANVTALQEGLDKKTIRAPFDGKLGIRVISLGEYISPGQKIVTLTQLDPITVNYFVPEQYFAQISTGQKIQFTTDAWPDETFTATNRTIEPVLDLATRGIRVQAVLPNKDGRLRPGMFANIAIPLETDPYVMILPQKAVTFSPAGDTVWLIGETDNWTSAGAFGQEPMSIEGYKVNAQVVETGERRGSDVVIKSGLNAGDLVVVQGQQKLYPGILVQIKDGPKPTKAQPSKAESLNQVHDQAQTQTQANGQSTGQPTTADQP